MKKTDENKYRRQRQKANIEFILLVIRQLNLFFSLY